MSFLFSRRVGLRVVAGCCLAAFVAASGGVGCDKAEEKGGRSSETEGEGAGQASKPAPAATTAPAAVVDRELLRLKGTWRGATGGAEGWSLVFNGEKVVGLQGTSVRHRGVWLPNPSTAVKTFEHQLREGGNQDKLVGIYTLEGDKLTLCYVTASSGRARPTEFSTAKGRGGEYHQVYYRAKP